MVKLFKKRDGLFSMWYKNYKLMFIYYFLIIKKVVI